MVTIHCVLPNKQQQKRHIPTVQERIKEEVLDVMGDQTDLTPGDLPKLKYLNCVFKECMRWLAIIPANSQEI